MLLDESIKITASRIASLTQADCCDIKKQSNPFVGEREGSGREGLLEGVAGVGEAEGVVKVGDLDGSEAKGDLVVVVETTTMAGQCVGATTARELEAGEAAMRFSEPL